MIDRAAVVSSPPMADTTRSVFEALGMTSNTSSSTHPAAEYLAAPEAAER